MEKAVCFEIRIPQLFKEWFSLGIEITPVQTRLAASLEIPGRGILYDVLSPSHTMST